MPSRHCHMGHRRNLQVRRQALAHPRYLAHAAATTWCERRTGAHRRRRHRPRQGVAVLRMTATAVEAAEESMTRAAAVR